MSIASELTALQNDVTAARAAITAKGGSVTQNGGTSQLATDIATIPSGGGGSFVGIPREVSNQGVYQIPQTDFTFSTPNNATDLGDNALYQAFFNPDGAESGTAALVGANLSSLTTISGNSALRQAFRNCANLDAFNAANIVSITGHRALDSFAQNTKIAYSATGHIIKFDSLQQIGSGTTIVDENDQHFSGAFYKLNFNPNTDYAIELDFPLLTTIYCSGNNTYGGTFYSNNRVSIMNFKSLTTINKAPTYAYGSSAQNYLFKDCLYLAELHFGAANQAAIEATSGYATKWGAPSGCQIYFDL